MFHVYLRTAEKLCLISSSILCVYVRLWRRVEIVCGQIGWPMSSIRVMCGPDQWRGGCCTPFATARGRGRWYAELFLSCEERSYCFRNNFTNVERVILFHLRHITNLFFFNR